MLVTQLGGRLVEVPPPVGRRLLADLAERWLEGGPGADIDALLQEAGLTESVPAERLSLGAKRVRGFALENHRAFYMNTSHHGIARREMFAELHGRLGGGFVFFVHDLIPIEFPEYVRPGEKASHEARMTTVLSLGATVIVNSEATRQAVERWAAEHGYPHPRTHVARIGIEPAFGQAPYPAAPPLDEPYFVCVSTIEPRKNHITLLHLWRDMARSLPPEQVPKLVLIGRRGWECEHVFAMLDRCDLLRPHVIELSALSDAQMRAWVRGACAALFPSFTEGWGMPVVEALALGVPVVCSDIAVFREATQGHAEFLDPLDAPAWRERILAHAAEPPAARALRRARLQGFVPPDWEEHFAGLHTALFEGPAAVLPPDRASWFRSSGDTPAADPASIAADAALEDFAGAVLAGDQARDRGEWGAAARAYRRALDFEPENAGIRVQFGHMAKEAGFLDTAYEAYCSALERMPADADLHLQLGHLFKLGHRLPQALAYYEAALALAPANQDALRHVEWAREHLRTTTLAA
jgi:glycosyltransferase involved in cell wall biosynthesis